MLTTERLDSLLYKKITIKKIIAKENVKDGLFWIFYKLFDINYEKYPDFETESKIKFDLLSKFDNNKELFKQYKLKREDIENDLIYNKVISIRGFIALCIYNNINIIVTNKKTYFPVGKFDCAKTKFPVLSYSNNNFKVMTNNLSYFDTYYKLPCIDKALEVISKYKVSELKNIAVKNEISIDGNKKNIYEKLKENIHPLINL